jgi:predicted PurR-regulated permease PerM
MEPLPDDFQQFARPWLKPLFIFLLVAVIAFAVRQVAPLLAWVLQATAPFIIALILAYIFHPIVTFVQRRLRLGRIMGIFTVALTLTALLVGLLIWLLPLLYHQLGDALGNLRAGIEKAADDLLVRYMDRDASATLKQNLTQMVDELNLSVQSLAGQLGGALKPMAAGSAAAVKSVAGGVIRTVGTVGGALAGFFFIMLITFYFLADIDHVPGIMRRLLPARNRERCWEIMLKADRAVGGFLRGQLLDCAAVGVLCAVLLSLLGLRQYAVLIGFFAGVANFIPYLGPIVGATPAVLWALFSTSMTTWDERGVKVLFIAGAFALVQFIDGIVFQPFIVGRHASLHPLMVMLALGIGAQFGIGGMIIAVPVACIARVLWLELFWNGRAADEPAVATGATAKAKV